MLDTGDYSIGTPFGGASQTGGELQLLSSQASMLQLSAIMISTLGLRV